MIRAVVRVQGVCYSRPVLCDLTVIIEWLLYRARPIFVTDIRFNLLSARCHAPLRLFCLRGRFYIGVKL